MLAACLLYPFGAAGAVLYANSYTGYFSALIAFHSEGRRGDVRGGGAPMGLGSGCQCWWRTAPGVQKCPYSRSAGAVAESRDKGRCPSGALIAGSITGLYWEEYGETQDVNSRALGWLNRTKQTVKGKKAPLGCAGACAGLNALFYLFPLWSG